MRGSRIERSARQFIMGGCDVANAQRQVSAPTTEDLARASAVVRNYLPPTRLLTLSLGERTVLVKDETSQPTGSFKIRGALAALHSVQQEGRSSSVLTVSAGNHGLGIAVASRLLGIAATIVVPETASPAKVDKLRVSGATIVQFGQGYEAAERHALERAEDGNAAFISPYNDPQVIAGQATLLEELLAQAPTLSRVVVPVGGGGLLAGTIIGAQGTSVEIVGVQPATNAALYGALYGLPFHDGVTAADGLAGDLEPGSVTLAIARAAKTRVVLVDEAAIARGVVTAQRELGLAIEASAAVGLAAIDEGLIDANSETVVLLTGRNVATSALCDLLRRGSQTL